MFFTVSFDRQIRSNRVSWCLVLIRNIDLGCETSSCSVLAGRVMKDKSQPVVAVNWNLISTLLTYFKTTIRWSKSGVELHWYWTWGFFQTCHRRYEKLSVPYILSPGCWRRTKLGPRNFRSFGATNTYALFRTRWSRQFEQLISILALDDVLLFQPEPLSDIRI